MHAKSGLRVVLKRKIYRPDSVIAAVMPLERKLDSKFVNSKIRGIIRPQLKTMGFSKFTARNAWRFHDDRVDVLNFQSFNKYHADVMEITTYSFSVNLGCIYPDVPRSDGFPVCKTSKNGELRPQEFECQFRGSLMPTIDQKIPAERKVWYIDPDGNSLDVVFHDVSSQIATVASSWYQTFSNVENAFQMLLGHEQNMDEFWGFGNNPSPSRNYLIGYFALKLGKKAVAKEHLSKALESGCFKQTAERIRRDMIAA